ncbi:MAG TPA: hypothetical protein PK826_15575 [Anaerolineae bacterium]|nr:hypothetical protein [Anaerolineae bacterium]
MGNMQTGAGGIVIGEECVAGRVETIQVVSRFLIDMMVYATTFLMASMRVGNTGTSRPSSRTSFSSGVVPEMNQSAACFVLPILLPGRRGMLLGDKWAIPREKGMMAGRGSLPIVVPSLSAYDELIERIPVP